MSARTCACGCGVAVTRDQRAQYATDLCKQRARATRRRVSRLTAVETRAVDLPKMSPTTHRVFKALLAVGGRGATTRELCQPDVGGIRLSARVYELRKLGFRIDVRELRPGNYRYTLVENVMSARLFDPEAEAA